MGKLLIPLMLAVVFGPKVYKAWRAMKEGRLYEFTYSDGGLFLRGKSFNPKTVLWSYIGIIAALSILYTLLGILR